MPIVCGRINEITHKALIVIFYSVSVGLVEFGGEKVMADLVASAYVNLELVPVRVGSCQVASC
jgi:hypothetical protein